MKALLFIEPNKLEIVEKELRKPQDDELIIKIDSCGVCGTDFHIFRGESLAKNNTILGHEFSGIIVDRNRHLEYEDGENVAVDPNIYCGRCYYCRTGKINFCENHKALGVTRDGGFAEYTIVPVSQVYKIPSEFPLDTVSFAEPLSCCLRGIDRSEIKSGESVIILGGGPIGLLMLQLVKLHGATKIILIEPNEIRRQLAYQLGADYTFHPEEQYIKSNILDITNGGADCVIECVGKAEAFSACFEFVKRGAKIILFGVHSSKVNLDLNKFFLYELSIKSAFLNPYTFYRSIELLINKKINVDVFPIQKVDLDSLIKIFYSKTSEDVLKYQFHN